MVGGPRGWELQPRRIELPSGACADVDGVAHVAGDTDGDIVALVECFARVTKLKAGQKQKLAKDALKLSMLRHIVAPDAALVLLVASDDVANWLRGRGWIADALDQHGIEVEVAEIGGHLRDTIASAQARQVMVTPRAASRA